MGYRELREETEWKARRCAAAWLDGEVTLVANNSIVVTWPTHLGRYEAGQVIDVPDGERSVLIWIVTASLMEGYVSQEPQRALAHRLLQEAQAIKLKPAPAPPLDEFARQFQARLRK